MNPRLYAQARGHGCDGRPLLPPEWARSHAAPQYEGRYQACVSPMCLLEHHVVEQRGTEDDDRPREQRATLRRDLLRDGEDQRDDDDEVYGTHQTVMVG